MSCKVFETEECRVWTGALGTPMHVIEDAEQHELDVIPFNLQIWLKVQTNNSSVGVQSFPHQGLYLAKTPKLGANQRNQRILLPVMALSCFSIYSPSPFVSSVLVVLDADDTSQQGYFFGRVRRATLGSQASGKVLSDGQDYGAFYDTEVAEELLAALHAAFPKVQLSSSAKDCLAKREISRRATGVKLGEMVKRRKTLSAEAFYGSNAVKSTVSGPSNGLSVSKAQHRYHRLFLDNKKLSSSQIKLLHSDGVSKLPAAHRQELDTVVTPHPVFSPSRNYKKTRDDQRHVYEIIREGVPCRLYFDLEFKRGINLHVDGDALVARLVSLLQLQLFRRYGLRVHHRDIYQLDSSTPAKFSRHLIFHFPDGNLFRDNLHAGAFVREFINDLVDLTDYTSAPDDLLSPFLVNTESGNDPVDKKQLFIDTGVYTRNRMFRVLGSSKFKKHAILRPLNAAETELDLDLFVNTLVCPYPSLESMELDRKTKNYRLLRCESSVVLQRSRKSTYAGAKSITSSSVECRRSIYPMLDAFIRSQATTGGVQGEIRAIQMLMTSNSTVLAVLPGQEDVQEAEDNAAKPQPWMIIYHMARNRWCANIRRPHKSNNVMFIVDIDQRVFYQKCHDPACQAIDFRSSPQPLPPHINFSVDEKETRSDHC
ncbi:hypothetical protein PPTG_05187 [Phytophthora nicotianae INRA-310]|uniref:DNA-directed primase/polymerase protein n=1 Tax=Phytophthora nicotianae (strain INRA-310) TaxID=761204 RepID=W2QW76_PHYN3|nr:hypothetical protein PPTG_05187 [Phytophthora nicotianae INRA-310]ETN17373.1 hypothetical protein PPTG_05187 [Phytophthora nicotianae INRA-310]